MIVLGIIGAMIALCEAFGLWHANRARRAACQPTLWDVIASRWRGLTLIGKSTMSRRDLMRHYEIGGRESVRYFLQEQFRHKFDDFSIDYTLMHHNPTTGKDEPGGFRSNDCNQHHTTVFFYRRPEAPPAPPPPPPPAEPVGTWTERDERDRIELFLANPLAFWLNPDWSDPREPFWMRDPAPLPQEDTGLTLDMLVDALKYAQQHLELSVIGVGETRTFLLDGERYDVPATMYREALRVLANQPIVRTSP